MLRTKMRVFILAGTFFFIFQIQVEAQKKTGPLENSVAAGEMALVPAGEFIMGMKEGDPLGLVWTTPQRKVYLPGYYIDKYGVTNRNYKKFLDATEQKAPFDENYDTIYNWKDGNYRKNLDNHPVSLVNWHDADAYCRWAGKKLPTEAEREKAARGTDGRLWPWGSKFSRFKTNTKDFHILMTMPVGSFPEGASPYGVMDMAGSLFEWTQDWYKGYPGAKLKHSDYGEKYKVTRGGAWTSYAEPYAFTITRTAQPPEYKHRSIGFRCVLPVKEGEK